MTLEEARAALMKLQQRQSAYRHAMDLIWYDGDTVAPKGTAANRAQSLAILSEEAYHLSTGAETVALLEFLDERKPELNPRERRMVELLLKDVRRLQKIPLDEYSAHERLIVEAGDVWERAKAASDFAAFQPYLERLFADAKRFAGYCAPEKDPYDYWLNEFEEGLDRARCDEFFATLRAHVVPLLAKVQEKEQLSNAMLLGHFPAADQERLARRLMALIGLDLEHVGLATTEHPFTASLGSHFDERITTHYYEDYLASSLYSVIHEGGHALYDTNSADDLAYTVLDGGVSMGVHESQSRFFENLLGRSRPFCEYLFPILEEIFPEQMAGHTAEELYRAVNRAEPGLIRTEADELTYPLHIMVRYELEKRVMAGELSVSELPGEWNRLYREYLGVEVPDDAHGVLQDIHWSGGDIGYFPSYAFGGAYGAQLLRRMRETVDVDAALRAGNFAPINRWLREHLWRHGCLYKPAELFERAAGEKFDPTAFTTYLEEKFGELYGIEQETFL
ncbi:MAG: carboxypeptidase M32 [Oscillospiraceae bacterium]|nr:carboxypeptidase M32 [Oscillospiraceae bacterium]